MHVKRLTISRYGPLAPFDESFGPFTVIQGPNERGKTLIIDALVRMLFKDELKRPHLKLFGNLTRVDESPEGFVVMATHAGEKKIGAAESIADVTRAPVSPEDFRNVFLIRDSDLALNQETAYYGRVSERLCGTRSVAIGKLRESLKKIGRLKRASADSALTIRKDGDQRVGEQLPAAQRLLQEMAAVGTRLEREGYDAGWRRVIELGERRERLEHDVRRGRAAVRRSRYERARGEASAARVALSALSTLQRASDQRLESWRALIVQRDTFESDLSNLHARAEALRSARDEAGAEWQTTRALAEEAQSRWERARDELEPRLNQWTREQAAHESRERTTRAVIAVLAVLAALGVIAVVAAVVTRSPIAVGAASMCTLGALACGVLVWRAARERARMGRAQQEIVAVAERSGLGAIAPAGAGDALRAAEHDARQASGRARDAEVRMRQRESDVAAAESAIDDKRQRIEEATHALSSLQSESGFERVEQLVESVARRRAMEAEIATRVALLRDLVPSVGAGADPASLLAACEGEIERELAVPVDDAASWDGDGVARLERELEQVAEEERATRRQLERAWHELSGIEVRVSDLGVVEAPVRCRTARELADLRARVTAFCDTVRRDADMAKVAIGILQEIEDEEREKVGELFGEGTPVSRWFSEITDGRYRAVYLDNGDVTVEFANGSRLSASALSGGTFDQLYLSIRASIAERMMPDARGFFILDDPFLKADRRRMHASMSVLKTLVARGWQVIYVTAKDEVVAALKPEIDAGAVRLIELERSLFVPDRPAPDVSDAPRLF
jgi:DNA repair exonuclease SbcCD ATPase subunit